VKFERAAVLRRFFDEILPRVAPAPSVASVLGALASLDAGVDRLAEVLERNPALGERWDRHVEKARGAELPRRQSFVILGMENARDFLALPPAGAKAAPAKATHGRAAQAAREALSAAGEKNAAPELAYAAGFVFDAFAGGVAAWLPEASDRKAFLGEVDRVSAHGLQSAGRTHGEGSACPT
jgi:hypothetical protein